MKESSVNQRDRWKPALGAALAIFCGLLLWATALGEPWLHASYDYLFRFGSHTVTNDVVLVLMDNDSFDHFRQDRADPWDRALHARLLDRLADDGCAVTVIDAFFRNPRDPDKDALLIRAMERQRRLVLMAERAQMHHPELSADYPVLPAKSFLEAANGLWGVAWLEPELDRIVRRHWPPVSPGHYPTLPESVARAAAIRFNDVPQTKWLRYYGRHGAWPRMGYRFALDRPPGYFRNKIVFIGTQPATPLPNEEKDEFSTPYTRWTGEATGGAEILLTAFLNLANDDWLRRAPAAAEAMFIALVGALTGAGCWLFEGRRRWLTALGGAGLLVAVAVAATHWGNLWFPWLICVGAQVPLAVAYAYAVPRFRPAPAPVPIPVPVPASTVATTASSTTGDIAPEIADYTLVHPPFGRGSYGKVWLARNAIGQWQALKVVYAGNFADPGPYDREFNGVSRYKPVSDQNPNLLRVDFVSSKRPDYFYYVMELGDALEPGWEANPAAYKPRDVLADRKSRPGGRLPVRECLRLGVTLADGLSFLHQQGLIHRDIKPQNVIYVNGRPKLADIGLIAEIRPPEEERTYVGTPGYLPPPPERPGTAQADIYALGMVLYVLSTGKQPTFFPEISTTLAGDDNAMEFMPLNSVILTACQPDPKQRYATAADMQRALQEVLTTIESWSAKADADRR